MKTTSASDNESHILQTLHPMFDHTLQDLRLNDLSVVRHQLFPLFTQAAYDLGMQGPEACCDILKRKASEIIHPKIAPIESLITGRAKSFLRGCNQFLTQDYVMSRNPFNDPVLKAAQHRFEKFDINERRTLLPMFEKVWKNSIEIQKDQSLYVLAKTTRHVFLHCDALYEGIKKERPKTWMDDHFDVLSRLHEIGVETANLMLSTMKNKPFSDLLVRKTSTIVLDLSHHLRRMVVRAPIHQRENELKNLTIFCRSWARTAPRDYLKKTTSDMSLTDKEKSKRMLSEDKSRELGQMYAQTAMVDAPILNELNRPLTKLKLLLSLNRYVNI